MYNWLRSHWRNGRHVVHDLPAAWASEIEDYLARQHTKRENLGEVRVCAFDEFDLAWIETEVQLESVGSELTYRRARYLHGIVQPVGPEERLTPHTAHTYLEQAYGASVCEGIAAQQRVMQRLAYPEDEAAVRRFCMESEAGAQTPEAAAEEMNAEQARLDAVPREPASAEALVPTPTQGGAATRFTAADPMAHGDACGSTGGGVASASLSGLLRSTP